MHKTAKKDQPEGLNAQADQAYEGLTVLEQKTAGVRGHPGLQTDCDK